MKRILNNSLSQRRAPRRDGMTTRNTVLETAGQVFAELGFAETTSKEICERAGVNNSAVNYYFGSKEGLYEEVLVEAHKQLVSLDDLDTIILSKDEPKDKLRKLLARMLYTANSSTELWGIRIYLRELASPSPFINKAMAGTVLPKANKLRSLIQELTGLAENSEELQRATALVVMPCLSLIMFPKGLRKQILPASTINHDAFLEEMISYVLGGLDALAKNRQ